MTVPKEITSYEMEALAITCRDVHADFAGPSTGPVLRRAAAALEALSAEREQAKSALKACRRQRDKTLFALCKFMSATAKIEEARKEAREILDSYGGS